MSKLESGKQVFLTSIATGKQLRIKDDGTVDGLGDRGEYTRFTLHKNGDIVRLQSVKDDSKWLRITDQKKLQGDGAGGKWTEFELIKHSDGQCSLRSNEWKKTGFQFHVGILPNGSPKPADQTGTGDHGRFKLNRVDGLIMPKKLQEGKPVFLTCVSTGKRLRIKEDGSVDGQGEHGKFAQLIVHRTDNIIRFQSVADPGKWLRITEEKKLEGHGTGGPWCEFELIKHGKGVISLKSREWHKKAQDYHVGILPNGNPKPADETATGDHARFVVSLVDK